MASVPGVLDFLVPYILFNVQSATLSRPFGLPYAFPPSNVQSATLAHPFWTSAYLSSASTSNPPLLFIPFGLPHAVSPLQHPIHRSCSSLLTSSCLHSALTSNPPCIHLPTKGVDSSLRSGRRKTEVHRTSCPVQNRLRHVLSINKTPLVHRKERRSSRFLTPFSYGPEGSRTPSENPFPVLLLS